MSQGHSLFGFCLACGAPFCFHHREIEYKVGELSTRTGYVYDLNYVDLAYLDSELDRLRRKNLNDLSLSNSTLLPGFTESGKKCTCGVPYAIFCPKHGLYK
jgi:hypothetical protein